MNVILLRYGEIHLKGKNRGYFEHALIGNMKKFLPEFHATVSKANARYVVRDFNSERESELIERLSKVFGLYSLSPAVEIDTDFDVIVREALRLSDGSGSFKVHVNRADKTFPMTSVETAAELGSRMLECYPNLRVDLHHPDFTVNVDMREDGRSYVFKDIVLGGGGMPVGTAGKGLLMLSGGIDSPVAGYMMAKRGLKLKAVHFFSPPYTSEFARQKAEDLAERISPYMGEIEMFFVPFAEVQEAIHASCDPSYMVIIMRCIMMKIASEICSSHGLGCIVTGESLGQVASQTLESMTVTNLAASVPVLRPLVGFDKEEIIAIARRIETFETSILPYDDCCTVFLPDNPQIHPRIDRVLREETRIDIESLVRRALDATESKIVGSPVL